MNKKFNTLIIYKYRHKFIILNITIFTIYNIICWFNALNNNN